MSFHVQGQGARLQADKNDESGRQANLELARMGSLVKVKTGRVVEHESDAPPNAMAAIVELEGEYDLATKDTMETLLRELVERNQLVVIDLSQALFIDSSFMHNLVVAHRQALERGQAFRVKLGAKSTAIRNALTVTGLLDELDCF